MKVKMQIRRRVLIMMLLCSLVSLIISVGLLFYGMLGARNTALDTGAAIGDTAAKSSSKVLEEQLQESIMQVAKDKARQVELSLQVLRSEVNILSDEMTNIMQNPQNYSLRQVNEPRREFAGRYVAQLEFFSNDINREAIFYEIGLAANIQDFLVSINKTNDLVASSYIASKNGFTITADKIADKKFAANSNVPLPFNAASRPWYQKAEEQQKLIFTDVFPDNEGGGLVITCAAPYFDGYNNFAGVVGIGAYLNEINQIVTDTKVGETGFGFVTNKSGKVIFSPKSEGIFSVDSMIDIDFDGVKTVEIEGKECYLALAPMNDVEMTFGIIIKAEEVIGPANENKQAIMNTTENFLSEMIKHIYKVFAILAVVMFILIFAVTFSANKLADRFIEPIKQLTEGVREIAGGDLNKKLEINTGDEIESLALSFNAMTDELQRYMKNLTKVTADKERIATELNVATNIQNGMLPNMFPAFPDREEFDIYATMHAAKEVGGDFYDFYLLDENHLVITIADVSGKGVPAALFMAISKTILRNFAMSMINPNDFAAVMTLSNQQLCQNNDEMMFVTVFMGMLDIKTGEFVYVNGGHNPPLVCHNDKFEYIDVGKSCMLGINEDAPFKQKKLNLSKGDMIFLYTDGVTEAMDEDGEQYLPEHLKEVLNHEDHSEELTTLLENIQKSIKEHTGNAEQSDDITMLALRLN